MCAKDFNVVSKFEERLGGRFLVVRAMDDFNNFIFSNGLLDGGFSSSRFTWCNNRDGLARIWGRLDRALFNMSWQSSCSQTEIINGARLDLDHFPLIIKVFYSIEVSPSPFKFLNMWKKHPDFLQVVEYSWNHSFSYNLLEIFFQKLKNVKAHLKVWIGIKKYLAIFSKR